MFVTPSCAVAVALPPATGACLCSQTRRRPRTAEGVVHVQASVREAVELGRTWTLL